MTDRPRRGIDTDESRAVTEMERLAPSKPRKSPSNRVGNGPQCPTDPDHGALYELAGGPWRWYCVSQSHDGRPATHALGEAPRTKAFWRDDELPK